MANVARLFPPRWSWAYGLLFSWDIVKEKSRPWAQDHWGEILSPHPELRLFYICLNGTFIHFMHIFCHLIGYKFRQSSSVLVIIGKLTGNFSQGQQCEVLVTQIDSLVNLLNLLYIVQSHTCNILLCSLTQWQWLCMSSVRDYHMC